MNYPLKSTITYVSLVQKGLVGWVYINDDENWMPIKIVKGPMDFVISKLIPSIQDAGSLFLGIPLLA